VGSYKYLILRETKLVSKIEDIHANSKTSDDVINNVIRDLRRYFENYSCSVNMGYENFVNSRFEMARDRSIDIKSIVAHFHDQCSYFKDNALLIAFEEIDFAINMSLYFCFQSNEAYAVGKNDEAWFFATEASKWLGKAAGCERAALAHQDTARNLAASGGQGRSALYKPLRQFVLKAVKERNYPSRRNAALSLKPLVLKLAAELRIPMSEQQAEKTITGWLKEIPFASTQVT